MKIFNYTLLLLLLLTGCQTMEQISIDQLLPAEVYYPEGIRSVAVIDHHTTRDTLTAQADSTAKAHGISWLRGNSCRTAEALAQTLADANYFDEVIICDTVIPGDTLLTRQKVTELTESLNVDMLLSVEDVSLVSQRKAMALPEWNCYRGVTDVKVYSTVQAYIPQRSKPLFTVYSNDSIYWEEFGGTVEYVATRLTPDSTVIREASDFAGTLPLKYLAPHWQTTTRRLYVVNSVSGRDAIIAIRENNWEKARELWNGDYQKAKKDRQKMQLAYNLAIYNEVAGDIDEGLKLAEEAKQLAYKIDKVEKKVAAMGGEQKLTADNGYEMTNYFITTIYLDKLKQRKGQLTNLQVQMQRFSDDF